MPGPTLGGSRMVCPAQIPNKNIHRNRQKQTTTTPNIPRHPISMRNGRGFSSAGGGCFLLNSPTLLSAWHSSSHYRVLREHSRRAMASVLLAPGKSTPGKEKKARAHRLHALRCSQSNQMETIAHHSFQPATERQTRPGQFPIRGQYLMFIVETVKKTSQLHQVEDHPVGR